MPRWHHCSTPPFPNPSLIEDRVSGEQILVRSMWWHPKDPLQLEGSGSVRHAGVISSPQPGDPEVKDCIHPSTEGVQLGCVPPRGQGRVGKRHIERDPIRMESTVLVPAHGSAHPLVPLPTAVICLQRCSHLCYQRESNLAKWQEKCLHRTFQQNSIKVGNWT